MSWKVEESWPAKKAKIEEAYRKRIERRLAVSREKKIPYDLSSAAHYDSDEDNKIQLIVPFTDSPLHGTTPAKQNK
jgi:hypothetical protein